MVCDGWCNMWAAPIKGKSYQLHCLVGGELGSCGSEAAGLQSAFSPHPDPVTLPTHPSTPTHPPYAIIFPSRAFLLIANSTAAHPTEPSIYTGWFFNCSAQISALKRKMLFNQRGSFVHQEFHGTESLIGYPSFFILILKIGRNSKKSTLYLC